VAVPNGGGGLQPGASDSIGPGEQLKEDLPRYRRSGNETKAKQKKRIH
jgi:hypothetical protein